MNPLLLRSASDLARMIRGGEVTSEEVVRVHIARAREVNPTLNAVVRERFDEALDEARRADARLAAGDDEDLPPLHGVPCTVKECFALEGMPWTSGLVSRRGVVASEDATAVRRLRAAGAIPLGVTNLSELCMWMESNNRVYGRTNNPYDLGRIVGGSSGGEAAIVAAGASPFGLGSDIGGSIRMPAFFNGVFGHKPTGGMVPGTGQFPLAENEALRYLATGPLARRAEDLMPLLRVLAGPDGEDGGCREWALGDPATVSLRGLRVLHVPDNGRTPVSRGLRDAQERAAQALEEAGAHVVTTRVHALRCSFDIWSSMLGAAGDTSFADLLADGGRFRLGPELLRWAARRSPHTLPAILLAGLERVAGFSERRARYYVDMGRDLRQELVERIGPHGVMLYPPYASVAPRHYTPMVIGFRWVYTAILNVMELPVTQVPLGLDARGLPLGVQIAAVHGRDHVSIAAAQRLEGRFGGWVPPARLGASERAA